MILSESETYAYPFEISPLKNWFFILKSAFTPDLHLRIKTPGIPGVLIV